MDRERKRKVVYMHVRCDQLVIAGYGYNLFIHLFVTSGNVAANRCDSPPHFHPFFGQGGYHHFFLTMVPSCRHANIRLTNIVKIPVEF